MPTQQSSPHAEAHEVDESLLSLPFKQSTQLPSSGQNADGVDDGALEGPFDGTLLGDSDGGRDVVGWAEGVDDGTFEGPFDGMLLGDADGRDDGRMLGDADGDADPHPL